MRRTLAVALVAPILLAGCGRNARVVDDSSGTTRFVTARGRTLIDPGERRPAPVLRGRTLDGASLDTGTYRGQVLVLNVWGSWCAPCKAEQPMLVRAARDAAPLGVAFVGIDVRDSDATARAHVKRYGVPYPSFSDRSSALVARFRDVPPQAIPTTIAIDRAGRVALRHFGVITYDGLMSDLRALAAEAT